MTAIINHPQLLSVAALAKAKKTDVFLVGGFLRDHKRGINGTDLDFAVPKDALKFAKAFSRRIKGAFVLLDKEHGSARVVKKQNEVVWTFDFTDYRGGKTIAQDLKLRDFTVNTFCINIVEGKDVSPSAAAKDLKAKTIRMTSTKAFVDDPLRLLRAFSLAAQTGFKIETKTLSQIKKNAHLINKAAMERSREELFKILESPRAYTNIVLLDKIGLLQRLMPQISVMFGVKQGGYHHLDVWKHTLEVLRQFELLVEEFLKDEKLAAYLGEDIGGAHSRLALLKLAALLHDIGKPQTRKKEKDRMTFHGHEHVGEAITRLAAKRLKVSVKERYFLENAVRMHLRPGYLSNFKRPTEKIVFRYLRDTKTEAAAIAMLAIADQRATRGKLTTAEKAKHHEKICRMVIDEYFKEKAKPVRERLLTGHDLIKKLKLKPSPKFSEILSAVEEAHALGKVKNKEEALELARTLL
jgi:poly(A) polymerase